MESLDDPDIKELRVLVEKNIKLTEDTNRIVHKLRRNIWWGRLWSIVWWALILGASGAAYYFYLQPYVDQVQHLYAQFQSGTVQAQDWQQQAVDFFKQFLPK